MNSVHYSSNRKERKRIYERGPLRVDEYYKLRNKKLKRNAYRKKRGLPLDTPNMKPWDYIKGRIKNNSTDATRGASST